MSNSTEHPGFWGGSSVKTGQVKRLSATTFKQLVSLYVDVPVQHQLSRREFFALPTDKDRDEAKDGAFLCACAFNYPSEGTRCNAAATHMVACVLDLDEGDFIRDMLQSPETISEALYPYNHAVWHTAKSRPPDAPRLKILVEVSPTDTLNHKRILKFVANRLGLPSDFKGVTESGVVSQAQYRAVSFRGDDSFPVVASVTTGIPISMSDIPEMDDDEREMVEGRIYGCSVEADDEFFGLAYLKIHGLSVDDITEPLNTLDPDSTRPVWRDVAAALRHQFSGDEDESKAAYEAFVDWSAKGSKFVGRRDCWNLWRSLQPFAKGRAPVTLRTLFKYAIDAGWSNVKVTAKITQSFAEWLESCDDEQVLAHEGGRRLAAMPNTNLIDEEKHLAMWHKRIALVSGGKVSLATLKKQLELTRREDKKAKAEAAGTPQKPEWLQGIVYSTTDDTFVDVSKGTHIRPSAFDRTYAVHLMPPEGESPPNGLPVMMPAAYALNILKILRVDETHYNPLQHGDEQIYLDKKTNKVVLNTFNPNSFPVADPEHADKAGKLIYQLTTPLVLEDHLREHLIDYLALQVQHPGRKTPWSFMIQSGPGAGKGTLSEVMQAVLGFNNVKIITPQMMASNFNEWAVGAIFGVFNEVHIPGERRDQVMNSLKPLITDPTIGVTMKHKDGKCDVTNYTSYIAFTNNKDAAHLSEADRRWCMINSPIQTEAQARALQESGHFDEVRWLCTDEGASALRYYLLKRVIGKDFPLKGHAPNTKYRTEVIEASKNQLQIEIEDAIADGESPLIGEVVIHEGALRHVVCRNSREHGLVPRYLSQMGYERESSKRVMIDGSPRGVVWVNVEKWKGKDAIEYLKSRVNKMPELDDPIFE